MSMIAIFTFPDRIARMSSSSCSSSTSNVSSASNDAHAYWFPYQIPQISSVNANGGENIALVMRQQKLEFEEKLIGVKQEVVKLHQELLAMKELLLKVVEDHGKIRPIIDDRKRNALLRRHQPFPFIPEHTRGTASQENGNDVNKND